MTSMQTFKCPACGAKQEALASEVWHECPARAVQADPGKGKKKLPTTVQFEPIRQASDLGHNDRPNSVAPAAIQKAQRRRIAAVARKTTAAGRTGKSYTLDANGHLVVS